MSVERTADQQLAEAVERIRERVRYFQDGKRITQNVTFFQDDVAALLAAYDAATPSPPTRAMREQDVLRRVGGALRAAINDHGPITKNLVPSAAKRVAGALGAVPVPDELIEAAIGCLEEIDLPTADIIAKRLEAYV